MEPTETSIDMMGRNDLSVLSQSYQPNFIKNAEDEDQSFDLKGRQEPTLRANTNYHSKVSQVVASDLRNYVKSKEDLYIILTIEGQLHLPPYDECTMEFMRDALSGRKKLLTNRELCPVTVPRYKEFNAANLQKAAVADEELKVYLPNTSDTKVINRRFLFNVRLSNP
jgi:hypothetical protein